MSKKISVLIVILLVVISNIFGKNLDTPVDFVLCYTKDGCEHYVERGSQTGGTGQAIELASRKYIPVINLANKDWKLKLKQTLNI